MNKKKRENIDETCIVTIGELSRSFFQLTFALYCVRFSRVSGNNEPLAIACDVKNWTRSFQHEYYVKKYIYMSYIW